MFALLSTSDFVLTLDTLLHRPLMSGKSYTLSSLVLSLAQRGFSFDCFISQ